MSKDMSSGEKYIFQQAILALVEKEIPFMVTNKPVFMVEGISRPVLMRKMVSRQVLDLVKEIVELAEDYASRNKIIVLYSVCGEYITVPREPGYSVETGFCVRFRSIDMEKQDEN